MRTIYYLIMSSLCIWFGACEDNKEQYWDDYSTILYFRDSGEALCTIYKPDDEAIYTVSVVKAGTNKDATARVDLKLMDEDMLGEYNRVEGTHYESLPAEYYSFETGSLIFDPSDMYKRIEMSFYTEALGTLLQNGVNADYVVPLYLSGSSDSINAEKQYLFVKPEVITPLVGFSKSGYVMNSFSNSDALEKELALPLSLSVENRWSFDCYYTIDESLVKEYNEEQGVNYLLLPSDAYTTIGEGGVSMEPAGYNSLRVQVNCERLNYGNYVLPLLLTGTSMETIGIDAENDACLMGVSYVPDADELSRVNLTEDMISYYPDSNPGEGSVAGLIDDNLDTYFHSDYNVGIPLPHWLQFALPTDCSAFRFEYVTRNAGAHVVPSQISLYVSSDGIGFNKLMTIQDGLPLEVGSTYVSPVLVTGESVKYIRLSVDASPSGSFALAEFRLWIL